MALEVLLGSCGSPFVVGTWKGTKPLESWLGEKGKERGWGRRVLLCSTSGNNLLGLTP